MTQADLAQIIRVSIPTVRALERGEGSLRSMGRAMQVLGLGWGWARQGEDAAALLAARRREMSFSQAALAKRAGCSRPTIIALERDLSGSVSILLSVLAALGVRRVLRALDMRGKGGLIPATNAPMRDLVMTLAPLAGAIIFHYTDRFDGSILDPARGQGAFIGQFPRHLDRHWCELTDGRDFLRWAEPVDWIMTNPPWSRLRDFTRHAMTLAQNIVWLAPIVNLTTKAKLRDLDEHGFGVAELLFDRHTEVLATKRSSACGGTFEEGAYGILAGFATGVACRIAAEWVLGTIDHGCCCSAISHPKGGATRSS